MADEQNKQPIKSVRTFEEDVAKALEKNNSSVVNVVLSEKKAQRGAEERKLNIGPIINSADVSVPPEMYAPAPEMSSSSSIPVGLKTMPKSEAEAESINKGIPNKIDEAYIKSRMIKYQNFTPPPQVKQENIEQENIIQTTDAGEVKSVTSPLKKVILTIFALLLIVTGGYIIYYIQSKKPIDPVVVTDTPKPNIINSIIPAEKEITLDIKDIQNGSQEKIKSTIEKNVSGSKIINIRIINGGENITSQDFVTINGMLNIPDSLYRSLNDEFMVGGINKGSSTSTFIVFKVNFFQGALASMLKYEMSLPNDMFPIIIPSQMSRNISNIPVFKDISIRNKDARILKNTFGETALIYSFIDSETLVITDTESSFQTIIDELAKKKFIR